jgi:hypothetical protein
MMTIASGTDERPEGGYAVRRPLVTDAIGGALRRSFDHMSTLPEDMRRSVERLDRLPRLHGF